MNRLSKQITYGIIFIAIITGAVFLGAYLIKLAGRQQNNPSEIIEKTKEIQITKWQEIKSAKNSLLSDYIIELHNPDSAQGAEEIHYLLGGEKGESYLLPLEKKISVAPARQKNLKEGDFIIEEVVWADFSKQESAELAVKEKKYLADDKDAGGSSVSAAIANKGKYDLAQVDIDIVLYDLQKNPIAVLCTKISPLLAGQERVFKVFWLDYIPENAGDVLIQASSNIMDPDNTGVRVDTNIDRFQDF